MSGIMGTAGIPRLLVSAKAERENKTLGLKGNLLRDAKFTPLKRTNRPCVSRNHVPFLIKSPALPISGIK
jgi:hypothetical protein